MSSQYITEVVLASLVNSFVHWIAGRYLRREKELAEARFEVIQAETNRLRQQVMNLKKQADAAEQALAEERQKTEVELLLFILLNDRPSFVWDITKNTLYNGSYH